MDNLTFDWDDAEHTILRETLTGVISAEDLGGLREQARQFTGPLDYKIDMIVNFTGASFGNMISGMPDLARNPIFKEEDVGVVVMVGMRQFMKAMLDIFQKVYPNQAARLRTADTLDQARNIIKLSRQQQP
jgi:hypothetical protein